ncbi:MAG: hypothetical protein LBU35_01355 [Holosporales bacterium]|jgi:hypothetical protein|nr:hypothetical protein [Holosporales bacterium]
MAFMRSYGAGYDGTIPMSNGCPFDIDRVQREYEQGTTTPTKIINFGAELTTDNNIQVTPMEGVIGSDGSNCIELLACSNHFESSVLSIRSQNIHRPGSARASDFWGCIPQNMVVPQLIKKLHEGSLDKVTECTLAFLTTDNTNKPKIVQVTEYTGCFLKFVDPTSYVHLAVFSFAFAKVRIIRHSYGFDEAKGTVNLTKVGTYCYEFDYTQVLGTANAH